MKLGSKLCALFQGRVFPPVGTAGAEALWPERLVVSRQQEIEGVQEQEGEGGPKAGGWWWAQAPGLGLRLYPRCNRELPKGFN